MNMLLLSTRAKLPQGPLEEDEAKEEDEDTLKLHSCGYLHECNLHTFSTWFYDNIASFILFYCHIDDSHLHFQVGPDGACGQPRFWDRFPLLWSGCRLTHGVSQGRVGFEVRLERRLLSSQSDGSESDQSYGIRIGWSLAQTSLLLGKRLLSEILWPSVLVCHSKIIYTTLQKLLNDYFTNANECGYIIFPNSSSKVLKPWKMQ